MNPEQRNKVLSLVLGLVIIALSYYLYDSIVTPYQEVIIRKEMTERVRTRMVSVKDAIIYYQSKNDGNLPPTEGGLDSLVAFLKGDSLAIANGDSMFKQRPPLKYSPDSLILSPIAPFNRFTYTANDTMRPPLYTLNDPDSQDQIGDLQRTTMLNAPSWN